MDYWKTLGEELARAGFSAVLIAQLKKQFKDVDIEDVGHMPGADLAAKVAAGGGSISVVQVASLQKLAQAVFKRLEAESRGLAPANPKSEPVEFTLRLRDADSSGKPAGYLDVQVDRPGDGKKPDEVLFTGRVGASGEARFLVPAAAANASVRVRVSGLDNEKVITQNVTLSKDKPLVTLDLKLSAYQSRLAAPLTEWQKAVGKSLPVKLAELYKKEKVSSLADLRRLADKLRKAPGLSAADQKAQDELLAHARLQLLSRDHRLNQLLVAARFTDVSSIAAVSRSAFIAALKGKIDEQTAGKLHEQAGYKLEVAKNRVLEQKVAHVNGYAQQAAGDQPCECDCQSAVSPLAYLADLLDFVLREVNYDDNVLTLARLEELFHQPFAAMPADCSASEELVRQIRICSEVLRREALAKGKNLSANVAIGDHPRRVYAALLAAFGTSSRELRLLRAAPDKDRARKAAALGIDVARLNELLLDETTLSETDLEKLFGWQDTTRDPLLAAAAPQLLTWQLLQLAQQWLAEDHPAGAYDPGATPKLPIIDPDLLTEDDFCRPLDDNDAYRFLEIRVTELKNIYEKIDRKSASVENPFLKMLDVVWPASVSPQPAWDAIAGDLNSKDEAKVQARLQELAGLHISPEAFSFLNALRLQATSPTPVEPGDLAREQALHILVNIKKRRDLYSKWRDEEDHKGISLSPRFFCQSPVEPALNPLRVSPGERALWGGELQKNSRAPIVDPDIIPAPGGDPAASLWAERVAQLEKVEDELETLLAAGRLDPAWLDERLSSKNLRISTGILLHYLGLRNPDGLQNRLETGQPLDVYPQMHGLTGRELAALLAVRKLVKSGQADAQDWRHVFHILIQAEKRRYLYPQWREQEASQKLTLSPDFFLHPDQPLLQSTPAPQRSPAFVEWRANPGAWRAWRAQLKARFQQQATVVESLRGAVGRAEEASLPALRDALVDVLHDDPNGLQREQNKKAAANALLINTFESECRKTTRIAQAIETLQLLVWGLLNGQVEDDNFSLPAQNQDAFNATWRWLQSYGVWRAAMFVFLYPENLLLPRLRPKDSQTDLFKVILGMFDGTVQSAENGDAAGVVEDSDSLANHLFSILGGAEATAPRGMELIHDQLYPLRVEAGNALFFGEGSMVYLAGNQGQEAHDEDLLYLPLHFALTLQYAGHFEFALRWFRTIYDFNGSGLSSPIAEILSTQASSSTLYYNNESWLNDELNPHLLAATRADVSLRFILISIVRCLLDYAEAEFTADTPESLARTRELYFTAQRLLDLPELKQNLTDCAASIGQLVVEVGERFKDRPAFSGVVVGVVIDVADEAGLQIEPDLIPDVMKELDKIIKGPRPGPRPLQDIRRDVERLFRALTPAPSTPAALDTRLKSIGIKQKQLLEAQLKDKDSFDLLQHTGSAAAQPARYFHAMGSASSGSRAGLLGAGNLVHIDDRIKIPGVSFEFCIPPNPILIGLRLRVATGLFKLGHCMNLAGLQREVPAYAAPTDARSGLPGVSANGVITLPQAVRLQSTQYRYRTLVERAKQLAGIAQQLESSYLSFLERFDQEAYGILRARQDLEMSNANVKLQDLRVTEAEHGQTLAGQQQERAGETYSYYLELLEGDSWTDAERWAFGLLIAAASAQGAGAIAAGIGGAIVAGFAGGGAGIVGGGITGAIGGAVASGGAGLATAASALQMYASFERRAQEWEFQRDIAQIDMDIAATQKLLADERFNIVTQEATIGNIGANHAEDGLNFLNNKFTDADLFGWMSGVVGSVYRYFLQQATATARLAQLQLTFERQETGLDFILGDYWSVTNSNMEDGADRRGMTGSARLLQDIYRMDQHAFTTDRRKLQMSKTISLATHDPLSFQRFRETGVLPFGATLELFDRDFPGHYLRLIKRVRTSVIALIPPTQGVKATLSSLGISRAVVSSDSGVLFEERDIRREPESVALTAAIGDSGVFELQEQPEMLLPFEGTGVAGSWEFRLPKAANQFDFSSIADVLVTIEYTALDSPTYRRQVVQQIDRRFSADRAFSFRQQFADAWYDLHQPDLVQDPQQAMAVSFATRPEDFPPNVTDIQIEHVTLYIARKSGVTAEIDIQHLHFLQQGTAGAVGGPASTVNGIVSTRQSNAGSWRAMIGKSPVGEWTLALNNDEPTRQLFTGDQIEDILFVITVGGITPEWPS